MPIFISPAASPARAENADVQQVFAMKLMI